ncbi:MAG TPA: prephenate dehydratase domain-containing protein [Candidatus Limnocylindrales bacterium]
MTSPLSGAGAEQESSTVSPRVAFQGEPGAFSEEGVLSAFVAPQAVALPTWRAVFQAVHDGTADAGVVPIERSSGGSVREIYDLLFKFDEIRIVAEVTVPVHLALLALPGQTLDQIERVYSIAQALDQADEFLRSRPWQVMTSYNTAGAAKAIADKGEMGAAAVASARVASLYGLDVLADDIQTGNANRTRFAVLAREQLPEALFAPAVLAGPMKTTLVWAVRNVPGSLYRCLGCFAERKINLSRLESRPSRGVRWEYVFWADMDSDPDAPDCAAALAALLREAVMVRVAGVYHRSAEE